MKKVMNVQEVSGEGLESLLGEKVVVWCGVYIYSGTLTGVNQDDILLTNACVVYETGPLKGPLKDAQELPNDLYVRTGAIEAYYKAG